MRAKKISFNKSTMTTAHRQRGTFLNTQIMKPVVICCALLLPCSSLVVNGPRRRHATMLHERNSDTVEPADPSRRKLFICTAASFSLMTEPALAAKRNSLFMVNPKKINDEVTLKTGTVDTSPVLLSSERCLLKLLPVKNVVFRTLEDYVVSLTTLSAQAAVNSDAINNAQKRLESAIAYLDKNRFSLEPVFNEEDSAMFQIEKAERGERLIEQFRTELSVLLAYSKVEKVDELLSRQKCALLALADIGELLVGAFPYEVPREGRFSFLPRLEGRCTVIFTIKRGSEILGNCTILADGFTAPITAGNFVDLAVRGFYTGLSVKQLKKKFGGSSSPKSNFLAGFAESSFNSLGIEPEQDASDPAFPSTVVSLPLLGSYREGFYDPLTGKPRRIPLEILRQDLTGTSRLSYERGFTALSDASVDKRQNSKPVLSFEIPGLVAFNHGEGRLASSEFFVLPDLVKSADDRRLLNGQYAPFGYVVDGYDMLQSLKAGDIIAETTVGQFGQQNLVKIRGTGFSDVMQKGSEIE